MEPTLISSFALHLDRYVALPETIKITAQINGEEKIIVAEKKLESRITPFPPTKAQTFFITMRHAQPLRLTEINPYFEEVQIIQKENVRFLAQPNREYRILWTQIEI